jgi:hypothetical protein
MILGGGLVTLKDRRVLIRHRMYLCLWQQKMRFAPTSFTFHWKLKKLGEDQGIIENQPAGWERMRDFHACCMKFSRKCPHRRSILRRGIGGLFGF